MRKDNPNPVIKRIAIKADCELASPALIGSGISENTDSDILRDLEGNPFLPGSTVAGVLRSRSMEIEELFGKDGISPIWLYDAELPDASVIELDGVALDPDNKVAIDKKKYDFEAIDTGASFNLRMLLTIRKDDEVKDFEELLRKLIGILKSGKVSVGAKTNRGFGQIKCDSVKKRDFNLTGGNIDELDAWIAFDWVNADDWKDAEFEEFQGNNSLLSAKLKLNGSLMIRDTRNIYENLAEGEKAPDYKHMSSGGRPVIFGTSWAGAFRSGLSRLLRQKLAKKPENVVNYLNFVFGNVEEKNDDYDTAAIVSKVIFSASFLCANDEKVEGYRNITRVKIDRFTGGAADGALFTEKPWYGGETALEIRYPRGCDDIKELLLLGLDAIDNGLIQVGGETSIGRGFFCVVDKKVLIDGEEFRIDKPKYELVKKLSEMEGEHNDDR